MSGDLKKIIRQEYLKCAKDPAHRSQEKVNLKKDTF